MQHLTTQITRIHLQWRVDLQEIARRLLREKGFEPEFPPAVDQQLQELTSHPPAVGSSDVVRDLRAMLWSSIDNDTSKDLDQLEVAERAAGGGIKVLVAIADVGAFVAKGSPIDAHASIETTTVYTGVRNFPMLPVELSNGLTSLVEGADKLSVVIEMIVGAGGELSQETVYRAVVRNRAQLTYDAVGTWLKGSAPAPAKVAASGDLAAQLQLQREAAEALRSERHRHGALNIETIESRPVLQQDQVVDLVRQERNPATDLIEDFMIAANGVVARLLAARGVASIRRVVRTPKRWDRIVELAAGLGAALPSAPDAKALNGFLTAQRAANPDRFADLSLAVIKLLGSGEYAVEPPGKTEPDHFGLAVQDYTHSTAPNRRFADLVTQRLVKALVDGQPPPYCETELADIARNCTVKEDAARKVEREMTKRIAALVMSHRIGETFDAMVTGVTKDGTFVRIENPHVEGMLVHGSAHLDVGDRLRVSLVRTDVERGFVDFARV
jgi:exoribonuclease-2